jgi:hypothetical protein
MRLSEWGRKAPHRDSLSSKVQAVVEPVLRTMGTEPDPECWIAWGDDPSIRYAILAPTAAGLVLVHVRVNQPGEGPRAAAKLVRWPRVQFGELAIETQAGRRLLSFQVEGQILRGVDRDAEVVGDFALRLLATAEGRVYQPPRGRRRATTARTSRSPSSTRKAPRPTASTATRTRSSGRGKRPGGSD